MRGAGRAKQDGCEKKSADRQQHGSGGEDEEFDSRRPGKKGEELLDLGKVGEGADVEGGVHELEKNEEGADDGARGGGQLGWGGEHCMQRMLAGCPRGGEGGIGCDAFDGSDEAVAAAGEGFDEAGVSCGVAEGFAEAVDGGVHAVVEVDIGVRGPEGAGDLVAGKELAGAFEQKAEKLEGLGMDADASALAAEFAGGGVGLEDAEAVETGWFGFAHGRMGNSVLDETGGAGKILGERTRS